VKLSKGSVITGDKDTVKFDIIIIGAGISGLSLAHYCAKAGFKTLVIEKSERVGGAVHSHTFDGSPNGFWTELGAHTCYNSYSNLIGILKDDGALDRLVATGKAPFKILVDSELKSIPSQLSFLALLPALWRIFLLKKEGQNLKSYYSKLVGRQNYERVLSNAFNAVLSQDADEFPADFLFNKRKRHPEIMRKFTLTAGLQTITDTIAAEKNLQLSTGTSVEAIETSEGQISVVADKGSYEAEYLAVATPAFVAAQLLQTAFPEVADKLAQIKVNKMETVGVALERDAVGVGTFANLIPLDDIFFSVVSRDVVPHPNYRGFTFHFRSGVADNETKLKRINEVLKVKVDNLTNVVMKDNFVPALRVGHQRLVGEIERLTAGKNLFLTGNYFFGLAMEDCISRSLAEFNKLATVT
jgi:protoporphyrinogen oxidase